MQAVEGKDDHHHEVGDEQADVEAVPAVLAAEGMVGVVGLPVVGETVLVEEEQRESMDVVSQSGRLPQRLDWPILRESGLASGRDAQWVKPMSV
jgi:hypothetical protein